MNPRSLAFGVRCLNAIDVWGTLFAVWVLGPAAELNPIMRWMIAVSPFLFIGFKLVFVAVWSEFVAVFAPAWVSRVALTTALIGYTIAAALHVANLVRYFHG